MSFQNERAKIQRRHIEKLAFIYVRQSTAQSVKKHVVSGQRQADIQLLAHELGWQKENIIVVTADTGTSGASTQGRLGYLDMLCEITEGRVGAVFSLESTRLGRDSADWHHLIKICHLTETLIIDPDGVYDASDSNDTTLMKFKALMGEMELRLITNRMKGARMELAKKGELRFILPTGFVYSQEGTIILDPNPSVQKAVRLVFEVFETTKTARGVALYFAKNNLLFPNYMRSQHGKCEWVKLMPRRVNQILHNPIYAGTYAYGRRPTKRKPVITAGESQVKTVKTKAARDEWQFVKHNAHPGYISWADFLRIEEQLRQNRTVFQARGASRAGSALLQGLALCGKCGRKMSVGYTGTNLYYRCSYEARIWGQPNCQHVNGSRIDRAVEEVFLKAIEPVQLNLTIEAVERLHLQRHALERQRNLQIEHAKAAVTHARQRLLHVDYNNQYAFDCAQTELKKKEEEVIRLKRQQDESVNAVLKISPTERDDINALLKNVPLLWSADSTSMVIKKNLLRCLISDVTITKLGPHADVRVRWRTQACTKLQVRLPLMTDYGHVDPEIIKLIETLIPNHSDREVAKALNEAGFRNMDGGDFDKDSIYGFRKRYKLLPKKRGFYGPADSAIIELIETLVANYSDREIARILNQAGFRNMNGEDFARSSIYYFRKRYKIVGRKRDVTVAPTSTSPDTPAQNLSIAVVAS